MNIYLVRHGESLANIDKSVHTSTADQAIPLTPRGHAQARAAGEFLHLLERVGNVQLRRVWTSPYRRARETAQEVMQALGPHSYPSIDLRESVLLCEQRFGLFDGLSDAELRERYPVEHAYYEKYVATNGRFWAPMPLGESRFDVAMRVHQFFGTLHRDNVEDLVIVSHGVAIRAFVMMWCHKPYEWFEDEPNPGNCSIRWIEGSKDYGYIYTGETI